MKRIYIILACLPIFAFCVCGCQSSSPKKVDNTTSIVIGYGFNSYAAVITDKKEIKELEKLFNDAKFTKSDTSIQHPYLTVAYSGKKAASFYIDEKNIIQLEDGNYVKSKQISFSNLYSIYKDYLSNKK